MVFPERSKICVGGVITHRRVMSATHLTTPEAPSTDKRLSRHCFGINVPVIEPTLRVKGSKIHRLWT